ncbi:C2H2 zinc finger [Ceratobasidium sp. AG-Ba]|nr:C2H2 zinc finger [Ceratobasidium sp. AG-Ba]
MSEASTASQRSSLRPSLAVITRQDEEQVTARPKSPDITYPAFDAKDDSDAAFELLCRMFDEHLLVSDTDARSPDPEPESPRSRGLPSDLLGVFPGVLSGEPPTLNDFPAYNEEAPNDYIANTPTGYVDSYQLAHDALGAGPQPTILETTLTHEAAFNHPDSWQFRRFDAANVRAARSEHPGLFGALQGHSAVPAPTPSPGLPPSNSLPPPRPSLAPDALSISVSPRTYALLANVAKVIPDFILDPALPSDPQPVASSSTNTPALKRARTFKDIKKKALRAGKKAKSTRQHNRLVAPPIQSEAPPKSKRASPGQSEPGRTCKQCPFIARRPGALKDHMRRADHNNEKPFSCPFDDCAYSSTTKANVKRHVQSGKHRAQELPGRYTIVEAPLPGHQA